MSATVLFQHLCSFEIEGEAGRTCGLSCADPMLFSCTTVFLVREFVCWCFGGVRTDGVCAGYISLSVLCICESF